MGIDKCIHCDSLVDEDWNVEWYREGFDSDCICDSCFEEEYSCEACGSWETQQVHHTGDALAPECTFRECKDCGYQWGHS